MLLRLGVLSQHQDAVQTTSLVEALYLVEGTWADSQPVSTQPAHRSWT